MPILDNDGKKEEKDDDSVDSDEDMPIVDNYVGDIQLYATILDQATKGNPKYIVNWNAFSDFVKKE
jgi:hypothetical protein